MPAERGNGPLGTPSNWPVIDRGTLALTASPRLGPLGQHAGQRDFDTAFSLANAEIANAGTIAALDGATRARYDQLLREFRNEIYARVDRGELTWQQAVEHAHGMRDDVMLLIRRRSTPVGRSAAEWLKPTSPPLNDLIAKKTIELFGKEAHFGRLNVEQQNSVYAAVVESAGKSNPRITARMRTLSRAGRGLIVLSLGVSVYNIATAADKTAATLHEGAAVGAGIAGGMAGGALAGLACGPGAPVCVTIGAFVGGAAAAFGVDLFWKN